MWFRWLALGVVATLAGCPPPEPPAPIPPVSTGKVRVRVFTEPSAVKLVATVGRFTFVATDDALERWDDRGGMLALSADRGLSGDHVGALAVDAERKWLWVLTEGGLGRYDATAELHTEIAAPPPALGIDFAALAQGGASLAPAAEGGVWLGTPKGLFFVSDKGGWIATPIKEPVHALLRDRAGWLWAATKAGLIARKPNGDVVRVGAAHGCDVADARIVVEAPGGHVLAIGTDEGGHERIAIGRELVWTSYRAMPALAPDTATLRGGAVVAMGGGRLYRIAPGAEQSVRPLTRDGMRLVPTSSGSAADWMIDPLDVVVPPAATALGAAGEQLLIGTRDLGTARYREADTQPHDWLRSKEMFEDATSLSVACAHSHDCWVATGARQAWHWTGDRFQTGGPAEIVLAVAREPSGAIYALHRGAQEKDIRLSRIDGTTWTQIGKVSLTTPGDVPEVSFARFASAGELWVGLRYRDGAERRPFGIAIIEPATGKVTYHRADASAERDPKMLPVPTGVVDADVRGGTAWFATNEGVARLVGGQIKMWTEADGLRSEVARAVTISPEGGVVVATGAGAGLWDGKTWVFPPALQFEINDVVATHNGQIWMATERGIAAWDGKKVRRVDTRRGLAEDQVLEIAADQFDRVWARGPGSLTLISQ